MNFGENAKNQRHDLIISVRNVSTNMKWVTEKNTEIPLEKVVTGI